jgi:hypothetical protein
MMLSVVSIPFRFLFPLWVTFAERYRVTSGERRSSVSFEDEVVPVLPGRERRVFKPEERIGSMLIVSTSASNVS